MTFTVFEHLLVQLKLHRPLGDSKAYFCHTPALNALPSRAYNDGRLIKINGVDVRPAWERRVYESD